ncbi:MAG: DUF3870 domain-containing protein [Clostridia bacterium]|nr:DUF3870 domain-containing protein [Clostridia bacterium]
MLYSKQTVYIVGTAKVSKNDPIASDYDIFFVGLIVDRQDHKIVNSTCNMVRDITNDFIRSILIGYDIVNESEELIEEVKDRFHGMAQKSVCAAVKDARNKYLNLLSESGKMNKNE